VLSSVRPQQVVVSNMDRPVFVGFYPLTPQGYEPERIFGTAMPGFAEGSATVI